MLDAVTRTDTMHQAPSHEAGWHVLWTRSHCEQLVHDQLVGKQFELFLPKIDAWSRSRIAGTRCVPGAPLFPGYLFLRHGLDKESYLEVRKARGLVAVLGDRWDRLAVLPEPEIEAIRRTVHSRLPARAHPYLREGRRVRITRGPLTDIEGILVRLDKMNRGLVVLSVELLQRSVAVEVDCTAVEPVAGAWRAPGAGAPRATAAPAI